MLTDAHMHLRTVCIAELQMPHPVDQQKIEKKKDGRKELHKNSPQKVCFSSFLFFLPFNAR
jgi:hypothetical protein